MSRLTTEFARLYLLDGDLIDPLGRTRAAVLELCTPADWAALGAVWRGVQTELGWPAPAIAVSGSDGLQLWFSLAEPLALADAQRLVQAVQQRYLADVRPAQLRCWPRPGRSGPDWVHAARVPAPMAPEGPWSAFVSPDLAPLFADSPSLDLAPSDEAQAPLLAGLASVSAAALADWPWAVEAGALALRAPQPLALAAGEPAPGARPERALPVDEPLRPQDPQGFLRSVMNDPTVPLALRVEAAKALLSQGSAN